MIGKTAIVWFRDDLRVADNPALAAAIETGLPVVPVYIWSPEEGHPWKPGAASRWWLHQSLISLDRSLRGIGLRLVLRRGASTEALMALAAEVRAHCVFWNRRYEPVLIEQDKTIKSFLRKNGIEAQSFPGNLLHEPWTVQNTSGQPFRVFTAFWNAYRLGPPPPQPLLAPKHALSPKHWPASICLDDLALEPKLDWAGGLRDSWKPGEGDANQRLDQFLKRDLSLYPEERDYPSHPGTSQLSPHLHFGEISARQIWCAIQKDGEQVTSNPYLRQLVWRDFAYHLLFHFPKTTDHPLNQKFARFPWQYEQTAFHAWTKGLTGYPMVDAGMRQLWHTGWMHNRVRLVVASFLVKHLMISWQRGAEWFWDTLVDADLANNTFGWQWAAGCGADAAPYFRIFNPVLQGEKFDPDGNYIRRWVPEISALPNRWIHSPWKAPVQTLDQMRVVLGKNYPLPIVSHEFARKRALDAFNTLRR